MRSAIKFLLMASACVAVWYGAWAWIVASNVAQVKATIAYHNQQLKSVTPHMVLKAEAVEGSGFPFAFNVRLRDLQLSMIDGNETYLVRLNEVYLKPTGDADSYRFHMRDQLDVLYAADKAQPEHYHVTISDVLGFMLKAEKAGGVLTQYRAFLPPKMTMLMELNGESKNATFTMPIVDFLTYYDIPKHAERPLWLFVNVLREALVFKTPAQ